MVSNSSRREIASPDADMDKSEIKSGRKIQGEKVDHTTVASQARKAQKTPRKQNRNPSASTNRKRKNNRRKSGPSARRSQRKPKSTARPKVLALKGRNVKEQKNVARKKNGNSKKGQKSEENVVRKRGRFLSNHLGNDTVKITPKSTNGNLIVSLMPGSVSRLPEKNTSRASKLQELNENLLPIAGLTPTLALAKSNDSIEDKVNTTLVLEFNKWDVGNNTELRRSFVAVENKSNVKHDEKEKKEKLKQPRTDIKSKGKLSKSTKRRRPSKPQKFASKNKVKGSKSKQPPKEPRKDARHSSKDKHPAPTLIIPANNHHLTRFYESTTPINKGVRTDFGQRDESEMKIKKRIRMLEVTIKRNKNEEETENHDDAHDGTQVYYLEPNIVFSPSLSAKAKKTRRNSYPITSDNAHLPLTSLTTVKKATEEGSDARKTPKSERPLLTRPTKRAVSDDTRKKVNKVKDKRKKKLLKKSKMVSKDIAQLQKKVPRENPTVKKPKPRRKQGQEQRDKLLEKRTGVNRKNIKPRNETSIKKAPKNRKKFQLKPKARAKPITPLKPKSLNKTEIVKSKKTVKKIPRWRKFKKDEKNGTGIAKGATKKGEALRKNQKETGSKKKPPVNRKKVVRKKKPEMNDVAQPKAKKFPKNEKLRPIKKDAARKKAESQKDGKKVGKAADKNSKKPVVANKVKPQDRLTKKSDRKGKAKRVKQRKAQKGKKYKQQTKTFQSKKKNLRNTGRDETTSTKKFSPVEEIKMAAVVMNGTKSL